MVHVAMLKGGPFDGGHVPPQDTDTDRILVPNGHTETGEQVFCKYLFTGRSGTGGGFGDGKEYPIREYKYVEDVEASQLVRAEDHND